jgi:hypothetical protein
MRKIFKPFLSLDDGDPAAFGSAPGTAEAPNAAAASDANAEPNTNEHQNPAHNKTVAKKPASRRHSLLQQALMSLYLFIPKLLPRPLHFIYHNITAIIRKVIHTKGFHSITYVMCDHCNLNCAACQAFSPIAEKKFLEVDVFERDMSRLAALANKPGLIEAIVLLGGEPLLHPEITVLFRIFRKYFTIDTDLIIFTNGILLNRMPDSFWESCRQYHVIIQISAYPIKLPLNELKEKAAHFDVLMTETNAFKIWYKQCFDPEGKQDARRSFTNCENKICFSLNHGRLYHCLQITTVKHLNHFFGLNLQVCDEDYIDIHAAKDIRTLLDFRYKATPFCRFCKGEQIIEWGASKKDIAEWI